MNITKIDYYDTFSCIAAKCPATCCAGWKIGIDEESLEKYQNTKGTFGNRLHNSIDWKKSCFLQYDHKCCFLNDDNLCDIYQEEGKDHLCETCRTYPRAQEEYPDAIENYLTISCPEVARIILSNPNKVRYITEFSSMEDSREEEISVNAEYRFYEFLKEIRFCTLNILQNRDYEIEVRMGLALAMSHDLQRRLIQHQVKPMRHVLKRYQNPAVFHALKNKFEGYQENRSKRYKSVGRMLTYVSKLKVLDRSWKASIADVRSRRKKISQEDYMKLYDQFCIDLKENKMDIIFEQLICYFSGSYLCTALYDGEIYAKMKFSIFQCIVIKELCFFQYLKNDHKLRIEDIIMITYRYSRELEHLDENLDAMDRLMIKKHGFCLEELLISIL